MEERSVEERKGNKEIEELIELFKEHKELMEHLIEKVILAKEENIDKLHCTLEEYRKNTTENYVDEVMRSIITIIGRMKRMSNSTRWEGYSVEEVKEEYQCVIEDLMELLKYKNINSYTSQSGERLDVSKHIVCKVEETHDKLMDKIIVRSVKDGYTKKNEIFILENVVIYKYEEEK